MGSETLRHTIENLLQLWPLWALVALVAAGRVGLWGFDQWRLARSGIAEIDQMDGETFERRLVWLFRGLGYTVERVGRRRDFGADLIVAREGERIVVQAS